MKAATKFLGPGATCTVLKLEEREMAEASLTEQLDGALRSGPAMVIDVTDVRLTSMRIGELVNLYRAFDDHWGETPHRMAVMDRSGTNREVMTRARLDSLLVVAGSLDEAYGLLF